MENAVWGVQSVPYLDGERRAAGQAVAAGTHGICRFNGVLERPSDHNRKDFNSVSDTTEYTAVFCVAPDARLRLGDDLHLHLELRDEAQRHGENE